MRPELSARTATIQTVDEMSRPDTMSSSPHCVMSCALASSLSLKFAFCLGGDCHDYRPI
jgi:hypothetical protein